MVRSVQSSPYGVVDYIYYNSILLNVGGCGVVNVGGCGVVNVGGYVSVK
jgi:hypothetical protein